VTDLLDRKARQEAETELGSIQAARRAHAPYVRLAGVPPDMEIGSLWGRLTDLRNDLAHVNDDPSGQAPDTVKLIERIKSIIEQVRRLELPPAEQAGQGQGEP